MMFYRLLCAACCLCSAQSLKLNKDETRCLRHDVIDRYVTIASCVSVWAERSVWLDQLCLSQRLSDRNITTELWWESAPKLSTCNNYLFMVSKIQKVSDYNFSERGFTSRSRKHLFVVFEDRCMPQNKNYKKMFGFSRVVVVSENSVQELGPPLLEERRFSNRAVEELKIWIGIESKHYLEEGEIRIATFNCPLFTIMENNTGKFTGIEAEIVKEVAVQLNLTLRLVDLITINTNSFGLKLQNGTWSGGVMGALYNGHADVGFCALWTSVDRDEDVEHTIPWGTVDLSFLVPRPHQKREHWLNFCLPFSLSTWIGILSSLASVSVYHWASLTLSSWISGTNIKSEYSVVLLSMFGVLTQSSSIALRGRSPLVSCWYMFCVILVAAYSSKIVARLTLPLYTERIDTVQQLVTKGFTWGRPFRSNTSMLLNLQDGWHRRFMNHFQLVKREDMHSLITSGRFAFPAQVLERYYVFNSDFYRLLDSELVDLRVMAQVTNHFPVAIAVRRGSPVFPPANTQILRLLAMGLVDYWKRHVSDLHGYRLVRELLVEKDQPTMSDPKKLPFESFEGAFLILTIGLMVALVVFFAELARHKYYKK